MPLEHFPNHDGESPTLRTAASVRKQLGDISETTLWRRVRDTRLIFPKPRKILGRLYFVADEVDAWIIAQTEVVEGLPPGDDDPDTHNEAA